MSLTVVVRVSQRAKEVSAAETITLKITLSTAPEDIPRESNTWVLNIGFLGFFFVTLLICSGAV